MKYDITIVRNDTLEYISLRIYDKLINIALSDAMQSFDRETNIDSYVRTYVHVRSPDAYEIQRDKIAHKLHRQIVCMRAR